MTDFDNRVSDPQNLPDRPATPAGTVVEECENCGYAGIHYPSLHAARSDAGERGRMAGQLTRYCTVGELPAESMSAEVVVHP